MSLSATELDSPPAVRPTRGRFHWALVTGAYAGVLWPVCWNVTGMWPEVVFHLNATGGVVKATALLAILGGFLGFAASTVVGVVGLFRGRSGWALPVLVLSGATFGTFGCGLATFAAVIAREFIHPLLSSSLAIAAVGSLAGFVAQGTADAERERRQARSILEACGWALAAAVCAGGVWAVACVAMRAAFGATIPIERDATDAPTTALLFGALGCAYGGFAGAFVGFCRSAGERGRHAIELWLGGAFFGALSGLGSVVAVGAADHLHPFFSSSLAMAAVGLVAGLCGYAASRPRAESDSYDPEEDEPAAPETKIEWVLRERKRSWRLSRPLARVLPVLVVAVGALVWAAFADSQALAAVGLLGFAVSWVLYRQEQRLEALEQRHRRA